MPVRNNLGKLERYLGNSNQDKNEDIYSKANSMISFMSTISNTLSHFRRNLKNTYRIYTDNVQGEDKKLIVPYESYVAAVNKYKRIKQLLDEFWRAFSLDYLDVEWLISKVSEVRQQHTNLMNQYNRIVDSSSKASQQLVGDLISTDKKHDKLSSQLEKRLLNFSALKRSLKDNKIVYQSFRGKKFYISISSDVDDLLRIFGFDKFSRDRKAKNVEETSSKPSRSSKSSTSSASKPSTPSKPSTTSKQTPGEQKSEDIFKLPSFIVSITASELKNAGISLPNIESIDDFITFAKNRWLTWSDIDLMSKEKNFDEFIKNESYLLPIARNFGKLDLLKQNYREMIELENLLIKSKPESENSLDKILNLDESYLSEQQLKFLNLKIGITEIGYHFMNFSIDSMVRKLILKYKEESQESISSMISSIDIKRMQIVAFKLMIFMQNKLAEKLNERLGLMKLRLGIKDSDEDKYIKSTLEDIKSAIRDIVEVDCKIIENLNVFKDQDDVYSIHSYRKIIEELLQYLKIKKYYYEKKRKIYERLVRN